MTRTMMSHLGRTIVGAIAPHSGSYRFACNRSKEDCRDSPALLSGLVGQEIRAIYRLIQITTLTAINADLMTSIIEFNPKLQFFEGIDGWQFEQANHNSRKSVRRVAVQGKPLAVFGRKVSLIIISRRHNRIL